MRAYLQSEIQRLSDLAAYAPAGEVVEDALLTLRDTYERAIQAGEGDAAAIAAQYREPLTSTRARAVLTQMIAALSESESEFLTLEEAAAELKISPRTAYELCGNGSIRCMKVGRQIRIKRKDLDAIEPPPTASDLERHFKP